MTVNIPMLRGRMMEKGYNVKTLASKIGIDRSTLYRKLQEHGITLTVGEMHKIIDALNLSEDEMACIFLFKNSQKREN